MGLMKAGLPIVFVAIAGGAYLAPQERGPFEALEPRKTAVSEQYELLLAGRDTGCVIAKGVHLGEGRAELQLGEQCGDGLGVYADAAYWNEEPDGSVAFTTEDGSVALRFSIGDGTAYEAYGSGARLYALTDVSY